MGSLWCWHFPDEFIKRFPVFVETGTATGHGISYAAACGWETLFTIERDPDLYYRAVNRFAYSPVKVLFGNAPEVLAMLPTTEPTFFWLDAHAPGHDYGPDSAYRDAPNSVRFPLRREMNVIRKLWSTRDCAILIDDLRLYAHGEWGDGNLPSGQDQVMPDDRNLDFLDPFRATHAVSIYNDDAGYALLVPHGCPTPTIIDRI